MDADADVIAASLTDPARFGAIFDRHASVLHRYLVRRIGPDDADTMVGQIFLIAFEKRARYDFDRSSARPWLCGIATKLLAKHRRREGRRLRATARLAAQRPPSVDLAEGVSDTLDASQRWPVVADAVANLPSPERDALLLHVWEGLSYEDVAAALDVPIGTVRSRLNRARRRVRELATASGEEEGESSGRRPGRIVS